METQKRIVCRLCLKICDKFKALDEDARSVLDIILANIKLTPVHESVMCTNCAEMLFKCFNFKTQCMYTHDYIVPFVDNKDAVKPDLKDVYLSKNENCTGVPEDQDICGFCMASVKCCYAIFLSVEKGDVMLEKMIRQCLPELDLSIIRKPVICLPCRDTLEICFHFVMNCLSVEDKIKKYCEALDVSSINQIKLSHLLQFKMSNVTADEADGTLVDIKVEEQLCEERGNVDDMDNVIFKNEEGFIPKNVLACKEESKNVDVIKVKKEGLCKENSLKEENLEKMEEQNVLLTEEIEIKTDDSDFCRFECDSVLPRTEVTTGLCVRLERLMPNLEGELSKPYIRQKLTNKNVSRISMYKCASCSYQTRRKCHFNEHLLKHKDLSEVTTYKCDSCSYQTRRECDLKRHFIKHKDPSEVTTYKCDSCSYQTKHEYSLTRHLLKHKDPSEVTMYKCDSCSFKTKRKDHLKTHLIKHKEPSEITMYKCDFCSFQTKLKHYLKTHSLKHKDPSAVTAYKCDSCSYQTRHIYVLKRHLLKHKDLSEITMYKCDSCSFQSKVKYCLKIHLLMHKDPSEVTTYKCDSCSYQTRLKCYLKKHLLKHKDPSEVTTYKCDSCSYHTRREGDLKRHLLKHKDPSEVTTYKCDSCSYQTKHEYSLTRHLLKHKDPSEVTMYKCDSCSFQSKRKHCIQTHLLKHKDPSEVTMYKCDICAFETKFKYYLKTHFMKHRDFLEVTI